MYSNDVINTFIELRAEGKSYRQIADQLKISIGLASKWNAEHEHEIKQLAAVRKEALFQRYAASYEGKLADLADELKRVDEELKHRDFECVSTEFLLRRKTCLQTRMEKLAVEPDLKPIPPIGTKPSSELNKTEQN